MAQDTQHGIDEARASGASPPPAAAPRDFAPGTHLVSLRRGYAHHGIYVGDGRVVHYGGLSRSWRRGPVEEVSLERFAAGRSVLIKPTAHARYSAADVVARARSRLGEDRYRIASNERAVAGDVTLEYAMQYLNRGHEQCRSQSDKHRPTLALLLSTSTLPSHTSVVTRLRRCPERWLRFFEQPKPEIR